MTSGKFRLGEGTTKDACIRGLLVLILLGIVAVAILTGIYAFHSGSSSVKTPYENGGCRQPELDPNGLSNWTKGAEAVAFGCFPGHQIQSLDEMVVSNCIDEVWVPPPPTCAALPISLHCSITQNGLEGTVTMWQNSNSTPTFIHGYLNTGRVNKTKIVFLGVIDLSRTACVVGTETINFTMPPPLRSEFLEDEIEIRFNSSKLMAYKKVELRVSITFIDISKHLTSTVVSAHQGNETLVMIPSMSTPHVQVPSIEEMRKGVTQSLLEPLDLGGTTTDEPVSTDNDMSPNSYSYAESSQESIEEPFDFDESRN